MSEGEGATRREAMRLGAGAGIAAIAPGGFGAGASGAADVVPLDAPLAPLRVDRSRVTRTVVGLRPYRAPGYRIAVERLGRRRTVVHHYGHGGAGITLSWGTAEIAAFEAVRASDAREVAVIGAGVIGLTTALLLARRGRRVTIYADRFQPHVTSNIAAAVWGPSAVFEPSATDEAFRDAFRRVCAVSERAFQHFVNDPRYGVRWIRKHGLRDTAPRRAPRADDGINALFPGFEALSGARAERLGFAHAWRHYVLMIDPDVYLRGLTADARRAGVRTVARRFESRADVARLDERLIVNCAGLGAGALFDDEALIPIRGALVMLLPQDDVNYGYTAAGYGGACYMYPRASGIVLGGSFERDDADVTPRAEDVDRILAAHAEVSRRIAEAQA